MSIYDALGVTAFVLAVWWWLAVAGAILFRKLILRRAMQPRKRPAP